MAAANLTGDHPASAHARQDALVLLAIMAALATIALTAASFWLSYEHLHNLAATHGLGGAHARSWAWPATVDLFIVIGEILLLRASIARQGMPLAIGLTTAGSGGSIALNIAAVGSGRPPMDYVVAAVPPVAALLAFGALMWQIHDWINTRATAPTTAPATTPPAEAATAPRGEHPATPPAPHPPAPPKKPATTAAIHALPVRRASGKSSFTPEQVATAKTAIRELYDDGTRPGSKQMQTAVRHALGLATDPPGSTMRLWRGQLEAKPGELAPLAATG